MIKPIYPSCLRQSRRSFIHRLSFAAGGTLAWVGRLDQGARAAGVKIPVGSNIYGWSQYYQREGKNVNDHLDEVLSALRDAGYDYLEGFVDVNRFENIERFAARSRAKGLRPVCLYTGARLHEAGPAQETVQKLLEAAEICRREGFTIIDCNPDPIGREKTDEELATQASALNVLGAGLNKLGLRLGVHNHTPEMANKAREFHHIFTKTEPNLVGLCYDVHWVYRGGVPPAECLRQYGARVVSWHLRQSRQQIWWEDLDTGDVDYEVVARFVKERQLTAPCTVELALEKGTKITRTVVENHRRSREFVRRVLGA